MIFLLSHKSIEYKSYILNLIKIKLRNYKNLVLSDEIIASMINVTTELYKDKKRYESYQSYKIANKVQEKQIIDKKLRDYSSIDDATNAIVDKLTTKAIDKLFEKLF